jgi:hypothetical protein
MTTFAFTKSLTWEEKLIDRVLKSKEKSFRISLKVYGELLVQKGNRWVKNTKPVTMQRLSESRAETDVLRAYYFKKDPDTSRCRGYDHIAANRGNDLIVTTKDITDVFGNEIKAYTVLQLNGNTNLVAQCQLLNGDVDIPKDYSKDQFVAPKNEELDFDVILVSTAAQLNFYYDTIDNTTSSKSKDDNYSSCLVGHKLLNYETGETDLVKWTTKEMDRPLSYLSGQTIPKDIPNMNVILSEYLDVIKNVREETTPIVNNSCSKKAIFKAFCLDITKLESKGVIGSLQVDSILSNINSEIKIISDSNVVEYWNSRFFSIKKSSKGSSMIDTKIKDFDKFICSPKSSWTQLYFTIEDWILWELFSVDRDMVRDAQDHRIYGHGGYDILGGSDRTDSAYQSLNFLRIMILFGASIDFTRRYSAIDAFEWAAKNIVTKCAAIDQVDRLDILSDKNVKLALNSKIYA